MFTNSLRSTALFALVLAGAALPSSALAQQGTAAAPVDGVSAATASIPAPTGPRVAPVDFVRWTPPGAVAEAPQQDDVNQVPNIAMMVVGAGAMVAGFIIGGDGGMVIAGAGGVVGLIGLWRYLR